ncbi:MAG TPA: signal peptidase I [Acidothermaceae bacterium]|nr:signal peptidase I [Acidothermaceae bacterium]
MVDEPVGIDLTAPEQSIAPALSTVVPATGSDVDLTVERRTQPRPPGAHRKPKPGKTPKQPKAPKPPKAVKGNVAVADIPGVDDTLGAPGSAGVVGLTGAADPDAPETLAAESVKPAKSAKPTRPFWVEAVVLLVIAAAIAVGVHSFLFQAFFIPSGSMENTLLKGDRVIVNRLSYKVGHVQRGQIVVFSGVDSWTPEGSITQPHNPVLREFSKIGSYLGFAPSGEQDFIKRVIGVPGDHVVCCNTQGQITVNGVALQEHYLYPGSDNRTLPFDIVVPPGRLWVEGDHRNDSADSRSHTGLPGGGTIPINKVIGRAFVIVWPFSRLHRLEIPASYGALSSTNASAVSNITTSALPSAIGLAAVLPLGAIRLRRRRRRRR